MTPLFTVSVVVEPDRQRLGRFVADAVRALGGNLFAIAPRLDEMLRAVRTTCTRAQGAVNVTIFLEGRELSARCGGSTVTLCRLGQPPDETRIARIAEELRRASEVSDPALLVMRNRAISEELERAKERAARELAELEQNLETKKRELQESLRQAETDGLTGLLNRAAYDRRLHEGVARALRQGEPLCLVLIDLDHFKQINDTHGHQYGDEYLRQVAQAMRRAARGEVDQLCRYGGDEFAIIVHAGLDVAERIGCRLLEEMGGKVSIGVGRLLPDDSPDCLVARADRALYEAKRLGRGRVISAANNIPAPLLKTAC